MAGVRQPAPSRAQARAREVDTDRAAATPATFRARARTYARGMGRDGVPALPHTATSATHAAPVVAAELVAGDEVVAVIDGDQERRLRHLGDCAAVPGAGDPQASRLPARCRVLRQLLRSRLKRRLGCALLLRPVTSQQGIDARRGLIDAHHRSRPTRGSGLRHLDEGVRLLRAVQAEHGVPVRDPFDGRVVLRRKGRRGSTHL